MKVTRLKLANFRAIEAAEFRFQPRFTLIVGVNGVGKSSVLDALRICMSRILPSITRSRAKAMSFTAEDIRSGFPFLDIELSFDNNGHEFIFTRQQWKQTFAKDDVHNIEKLKREILNSERLSDRARTLLRELNTSQRVVDSDNLLPSFGDLEKSAIDSKVSSNCIYFSTNRSFASDARGSKSRAAGDEAAAYADALMARPLYLVQLADWMRVQEALERESQRAKRHLEVLRSAARRFLPAYKNLRPNPEGGSRLVVDHAGVTLNVSQLSEGERGVLALVLELARRLSQANPSLEDPLLKGEAIVLIDEIDLHLHPKWQRTIVGHLTKVFPRCQFVATTHSPQVVAAVEPEQVLLMNAGEVIHPDRSLGMDSNWILRHLMETDERPRGVADTIKTVEALIRKGSFKKAFAVIATARDKGLDLPEWSVLEARIARLEHLR
jgi:predicted ATP-binding protein involved in virulence